jgi:hypothetical protein
LPPARPPRYRFGMQLRIETFSNAGGGNAFYKAVTHPKAAAPARDLLRRLAQGGPVAVYDPLGFAEGFDAVWDLGGLDLAGVFVQDVEEIGRLRLGRACRPATELARSGARSVLVAAFEPERLVQHVRHLLPAGAAVLGLDALRLPEPWLTNRRRYLDPLNFATNFAFFRDAGGLHTRLVTANYWPGYGGSGTEVHCLLFDAAGDPIAEWSERPGGTLVLDSREIRARFGLPEFTGQLFLHVSGAAGHDIVKYALDTWGGDSLSSTHDANSWPADFYAGLPAPDAGERVRLWVQNSHPVPIPKGAVALNLMGRDAVRRLEEEIPPFASRALDVAALFPGARWPQQFEVAAGRWIVRPRYEVERAGRTRIAHPNVERTDLRPEPRIAELGEHFGKGFLLPAPVLPQAEWRSTVLPTPMARTQKELPVAAIWYDSAGREAGRHRFGRLPRAECPALDAAPPLGTPWGHVELVYDLAEGGEADGWLHALFRYERRDTGHAAETSFGAHLFNSPLVWRGEPQSYAGRPPGLSTRLFLRIGAAPHDTFCHLVYPVSESWAETSETELSLHDSDGSALARERVRIPRSGSLFWRVSEVFPGKSGAYAVVRDPTCRLFGYHGLIDEEGRFSLDHMFGF